MKRVHVVTDSTADIPAALASELDITVVPCQVYWGDEVYRDGLDLTPEEFYDKLARRRELPRTTQPPLSSFVDAYRALLADPECAGIVSIHVAGSLSGTLNGAWAASQTLEDAGSVAIVDSGQVSMGLGWAVIEAAGVARSGASLAEVQCVAEASVPRLRAAAMIDSLDNLYKGGRVSRLMALLGTALEIKPLINIQNGQVAIVGRARTRSKALDRLVALAQDWGTPARTGVLHAGVPELAEELARRLRAAWSPDVQILGAAGAALTTHLGLGAVGLTALLA